MTSNRANHEFYMGKTPSKWFLYKTAIAKEGAIGVREGDVVSIVHTGIVDGCHWFMVTATQNGRLELPMCYPDYKLRDFVL